MAIYRGAGGPGDATTDAANEASVASNKATEAAASALAAANSASAAAASATSAANSASSASSSASSASSSASSASSSASAAASSATSSSNFATSSASSASDSASSATDAETAQGLAETAQAAAEAAQAAAELAQTGAETAETNAETAQTAAEAARDAALSALDNFDDRYLGAKTSDPTLDNDGNALVSGALYFNTTTNVMKVYDGSAWRAAYADVSGALLASNNLSDLANTTTARTNLGLGTAATTDATDYATAAQGALADSALQSETDPVFTASDAAGITSTDITNWDTAYGWGNHASAGYLTSETYTGTVTSVDMTVPTGLSVSGNPVTSSGTLAVSYASGYAIPTTTKQSNWDDAYTFVGNFPTQTGNSGKYLTTDGSALSWDTVDALPDQTGHSGEFLTTDGSTASWAEIATGNTTATGIWENSNTISSNYTITTNYNAMSVGPITVASGVTVTVPSGSTWVII